MKKTGIRAGRPLLAALLLSSALAALADGHGWLYYGGDQGGRHYSGAAQIDRDNVARLEEAWVFRSGEQRAVVLLRRTGYEGVLHLPLLVLRLWASSSP